MSTKREEEKNEKIIRGLLKLPPNRRCINCNSLGPQYVCTDFWTFVCISCSGIHREFTHRVKSVSMAKFTKQEVEALQSGGNQRARELFLKEWDMQQRRLPDSGNADRIREFIKDVYVNKKYSGKKSSNIPPAEVEDPMNHEDFRRASSYHSFSHSPPYDYQYEDRRYGKQFGMLTRNQGSDRSQYLAKTTSVIYSPGRRQMYEDRIAHESSGSRTSDFSVSSAGDHSRNYAHSPNSQDAGYGSPRVYSPKDIPVEDVRSQMPNRNTVISASSSSFASNSGHAIFKLHTTQQPKVANASRDSHSGLNSKPPSTSLFEQKSPAVSFGQPSTKPLEEKPPSASVPQNEGWATFDIPKHSSSDAAANTKTSISQLPVNEVPKRSVSGLVPKQSDTNAAISTGTPTIVVHSNIPRAGADGGLTPNDFFAAPNAGPGGTLMHNQWQVDLAENNKLVQPDIAELWNAFDFSSAITSHAPVVSQPQISLLQLPAAEPTSYEQYNFPKDAFQVSMINSASGGSELSFDAFSGPSISAPFQPSMAGLTPTQKSMNPFDVPYDSDSATTSSLFGMGSLQAALPNAQPSRNDYFAGLSQPWFPQNSMQNFHPALAEGQVNLQYMPGQGANPPLPTLHPQGHTASFGGNPFA